MYNIYIYIYIYIYVVFNCLLRRDGSLKVKRARSWQFQSAMAIVEEPCLSPPCQPYLFEPSGELARPSLVEEPCADWTKSTEKKDT